MTRPKVLYLVSEDWYFWSHRRQIASAAQHAGFDVIVVTSKGDFSDRIRLLGFTLVTMPVNRGVRNPLKEIATLRQLVRIYREYKPDIVHQVSLKNVVLGTLAARYARVPAVVNVFAGLGYMFTAKGAAPAVMRSCVRPLLRWSLRRHGIKAVFQNQEDYEEMIRHCVITPSQALIKRGVGVELSKFRPSCAPPGPPVVLLASRMLRSKGVFEFVEAARILKESEPCARFVLVGRVDTENPEHISRAQLTSWQDSGVIEWWDNRDDMASVIAGASIVCLPTFYGEGLPKILLEAAACGKPIVATDFRGCREICRDGINGLLVPPKEVQPLVTALKILLDSQTLRQVMGAQGRRIVEQEFSAEDVARRVIEIYKSLLPSTAVQQAPRTRAA